MNLDVLKAWKSNVVELCTHKKISFTAAEIDTVLDHHSALDKYSRESGYDEINMGWVNYDIDHAKRMISFALSGRFSDDIVILPVHETYPIAEELISLFDGDVAIYSNALFHLTQKPYLRAWHGITDAEITTAFAIIKHDRVYMLLIEE
jgi:hypothetical protein